MRWMDCLANAGPLQLDSSLIFDGHLTILLSNVRQNKDGAGSKNFYAYCILTNHPSRERKLSRFYVFLVCTQEIDTQTDTNQWNGDFIQYFIASGCRH